MILIKKLNSLAIAKGIIFFIFLYLCFEYKTFEHRLYHAIFKIVQPVISIPSALPFDIPFCLSDLLILISAIFLTASHKNTRAIFKEKASLFLLLFLVIALVSILSCPYEKDLSRIFRVSSLVFAFLFFISLNAISTEKLIKHVLLIICVVSAFEMILTIYQYFKQAPMGLFKLGEPKVLKNVDMCAIIPSANGKKWLFELFKTDSTRLFRAYGTFSHPNILSCFLMTSILSCAYFWFKQKKLSKIGLALLIFFQITALFLTFSRAATGAVLITFYGLIFFTKKLKLRSKILYSVAFLSFFLINIILFYPVLNKRGSFSISNKFSKGSNQQRIASNSLALRIIKKHYFLGIGFDHFMKNAYHFKQNNESYQIENTIHNIYLLIAAEMGLIALIIFLAFLASLFLKLRHLRNDLLSTLVMIFAGYLIIGMFDYYLILTQKGKIMFFGIAGLVLGYANYLQSCRLAQRAGNISILYSKELKEKC